MAALLGFEIQASLHGAWGEELIRLLNQALEWWDTDFWDGGDTETFVSVPFSELDFAPDHLSSGPVYGEAEGISLMEILEVALNGGTDPVSEEELPLEERDSYDEAVQESLLKGMYANGCLLVLDVEENVYGEELGKRRYQISSDGGHLLVKVDEVEKE